MVGYGFTLAVGIICIVLGVLAGWYLTGHKYCIQLNSSNNLICKSQEIIRIYDVWMMVNESGKSIGQFLKEHNIRKVAVYGMAALGIRLYYELQREDDIEVKYALDQNPQTQIPGIDIYKPNAEIDDTVDAVIVTALRSYDVVSANLREKGYTKVLALDEILYDMLIGVENDKIL